MSSILVLLITTGILENGIYKFTFLVTMPRQMPRDNVWTISLCEANGGCISASDKTVLVMFPVPGLCRLVGSSAVGNSEAKSATMFVFGGFEKLQRL